MTIATGNRGLARVAGTLGIGGQIAGAFVFLLAPAFIVPSPANYCFFVAWAILLGLAIAWWRRHPWRSFLVPVLSVPIAWLLLEVGKSYLGWAP